MFLIKPRIRQKWYVVFEPAGRKQWFHRFLEKDFTHCYLMTKSEAGLFWIIINPAWETIHIDYRLVETFPNARDYAGDHAIIVEYETSIQQGFIGCQLGILTCVDLAKRVLGIKSYKIWTPYQLYRRLRDGRILNRQERCQATSTKRGRKSSEAETARTSCTG